MLRCRLKKDVRQASDKLEELHLEQVIELQRTVQTLIWNGHLAQVEGSTDHAIGKVDWVEEVLFFDASVLFAADLVEVDEVDDLIDRDHSRTGGVRDTVLLLDVCTFQTEYLSIETSDAALVLVE